MNTVKSKLMELKSLGFEIAMDNRQVFSSLPIAHEYITHTNSSTYVLGSVPAHTENLLNVEYDICYDAIEKFYNLNTENYDSQLYKTLHNKCMELDDCKKFVEFTENFIPYDLEDVREEMEEYILDYFNSVVSEIDEIINDIKEG
ncbi:hypothetical protein NXG04_07965 [Klebsiella pneumoniae]|nr:hypothetical protein [Klebsiella pneumoniae]MDS7714491.1 hypothetical protein [Klebsiella pneumoniae]